MTAPPIIYVVDDDASFRTALGDLLAVCGYTVVLCESAKRLLEASPGEEPGCILLDVQMSELSGPQLQDRLTDLGCRLPIVFITGHGDIPTTVQTIKAGAEDFLTKPVQKEVLLAAIERALVRHEATRARIAGSPNYARAFPGSRRANARSWHCWSAAKCTSRSPIRWVPRSGRSNCIGTM